MNTFSMFAGAVMVVCAVVLIAFATLMVYPTLSEDCSDSWNVPLCDKVLGQLRTMFVISIISGGLLLVFGILLFVGGR